MGFPFFPFTNFHEINMDWIIKFIKKAKQDLAAAKEEVDEAVATVEGYGERLEGAEEDINRLELSDTAQNTAIENLDDRITAVSTGVADLVNHAVQTYDQTEQFTEAEKAQARTNIGAVALSAYNTNNNRVNSILEYQGNQISALAPVTFTLNDGGTWPAQSIPEANRAAILLAKNTLVNKTTLVYATITQQTYQELPSGFIVAMVCVGDNILSGTFEQTYYDAVNQEYGTLSATITVDTVHWTWDMSCKYGTDVSAADIVNATTSMTANQQEQTRENIGAVSKTGIWQVKPQNIEGVTIGSTNILNNADRLYCTQAEHTGEGGYVTISSTPTMALIQNSATYCSFLIPVKPNTHYSANHSIRFAALLKNLSTEGSAPVYYKTVVGAALANITSFDTGEADHIIVSWNFNSYPINDTIISEGNTPTDEPIIVLPDWLITREQVIEKPKYASVSGDISAGGNLQLTAVRNNLRKNERIVFEGNISTFNSLKIGLTYGTTLEETQQKNVFVIDGTNISYYATNTSAPVTVAHGLTVANNIQIIWEMTDVASCKITVISNGAMFAHEFTNFVRQTIGNPFVLSINTVLTACKLSWTCGDLNKNIWMFGNSYFSYSTNRWTYYLHEYGYDKNVLLDGFPGEGGVNGRVSFSNLLAFGTPKIAVWCLGMNDGSDSASAPSESWVTQRDYFLQYCEDNNIAPIFGTIPTVPTINHEQKNAWVRSSGYRYIDFAKAVGASSSGTWFSGMLSQDGVHPTEQGAKALFAQVLVDLPEIMVDNFDY